MLQGNNPQTGQQVQEWGCSIAWIPLLLVENSKHIMNTQAATESFRNDMVKSQNVITKVLSKNPSAKKKMKEVSSIFANIAQHQKALENKDENLEDETIGQLSNNKLKVKKGKKDGNNSK
jgi:hypothetical protein